jgi:hypothetical protein
METRTQHEFWHKKSRQFHMFWFVFLGGLMVLEYAFRTGLSITDQAAFQFSKFSSEILMLKAVRMFITRIMPIHLGTTLGFLSPLLAIFACHMLAKSEMPIMDQEKILVQTHIRSMLITSPVLFLVEIITALITGYFVSSYGNLADLIDSADYIRSFILGIAFLLSLSGLALLEIRFLYKSTKLKTRIAVCIASNVVNLFAIMVVNNGIIKLLG